MLVRPLFLCINNKQGRSSFDRVFDERNELCAFPAMHSMKLSLLQKKTSQQLLAGSLEFAFNNSVV